MRNSEDIHLITPSFYPPVDSMKNSEDIHLITHILHFQYKQWQKSPYWIFYVNRMGHHGHDHMVVGLTTTYAISAYHHYSCEFESHSCW
jgi:hypothetical protein